MAHRATSLASKRVRTHRKAGCAAGEKCGCPGEVGGHSNRATLRVRTGSSGESAGRLSGDGQLLRVFIATTIGLGIENELPRAKHENPHDRKIIATETGGRFEFIAVLVRSLKAHLVEGAVTVLRLGRVGEDAGGDAA